MYTICVYIIFKIIEFCVLKRNIEMIGNTSFKLLNNNDIISLEYSKYWVISFNSKYSLNWKLLPFLK